MPKRAHERGRHTEDRDAITRLHVVATAKRRRDLPDLVAALLQASPSEREQLLRAEAFTQCGLGGRVSESPPREPVARKPLDEMMCCSFCQTPSSAAGFAVVKTIGR